MNKLQQKLMFGLGLSAAVADADGAGYLDLQESLGAQQLRGEYAFWCTGLVAEYIALFREPALAKQAIRADFLAIAAETDTGRLTDDETALIDRYVSDIDVAIERVASKPDWQRKFVLWDFRTPHFVKAWLAIVVVCSIALPLIIWVVPK